MKQPRLLQTKTLRLWQNIVLAGKYTVFATPGEKSWTFMFNSENGQWGIKRTGEANFDPAKM